ncbi:feruloyl esterase b precursor [Phlyctema vagabunda]|uniref:Carboxylic ester hydrolase n=1 Tax=Phlyctema vagabunda TaxID=108571 RepID=A0ABR4PQI0_9HELO
MVSFFSSSYLLQPAAVLSQLFVSGSMNETVAGACSSSHLVIPPVFGTSILGFSAVPVLNYNQTTTGSGDVPTAKFSSLDFCNVTITYTHPGQDDALTTQIWLPLTRGAWNERLQGAGGSGWITGQFEEVLPYAVAEGYAAACTDGGHAASSPPQEWALRSEGNVDLFALQNFASVALHEMTLFAKSAIAAYYGTPPAYSYWNGCSTGGRQGMMLAQRFPTDYDGILAIAPAINWDQFIVAEFWGQFLMNQAGVYPDACEFDAITARAIEACDEIDGIKDGVISAPGLCRFDPTTLAGQAFTCGDKPEQRAFSPEATRIANQMWQGAQTEDGQSLWYGLTPDTTLARLVGTSCSASNGSCTGQAFQVSSDWIQLFLQKSQSFDSTSLTREQYTNLFAQAHDRYNSLIGTSNPDLSLFKAHGGKLISWHGLTDQLIFPNGTSDYYSRVQERDADVRDFYRYFEAPGTLHCRAGAGPFPVDTLKTLTTWVEKGIPPDTLQAKSVDENGIVTERNLCLYPLVQRYVGGDVTKRESFVCADSF